jgi:hypothetical protein
MCSKVRARSAKDGSGIEGWSLPGPGPACFRRDEGDVIFWSLLVVFKLQLCLLWPWRQSQWKLCRRFEYIHKPGEPDQPLREGCAEIRKNAYAFIRGRVHWKGAIFSEEPLLRVYWLRRKSRLTPCRRKIS